MNWDGKLFGALFALGLGCQTSSLAVAESRDPESLLKSFRNPSLMERAGVFDDGGTVAIRLIDASSQTLTFFLDGRLQIREPWDKPSPKSERQLYLGLYPGSPEAKAVSIGGAEEKRILQLLEAWKAAGSPMSPPMGDLAAIEQVRLEQRSYVDRVIQTLKQRDASR